MRAAAVALALLLAGCAPPAAVRLAVRDCVASLEVGTVEEWREALEGCTE